MSEAFNALVAVAVIVLVVRWATSGTTPSGPSAALGFKPKNVTDGMVDTVSGMFPDIPRDNIRFDLLRTGSVEATTNKILERGFLDAPPPAYYNFYPRESGGAGTPAAAAAGGGATQAGRAGASASGPKPANLITRLGLQDRVDESAKVDAPEAAAGKAVWEDSAEKREASLRERKAQMVLAARQRLLAQQQKATAGGSSTST